MLFGESEEPASNFGADDVLLQVNLRLKLNKVAEIEAKTLFAQERRGPTGAELRNLAGRIYDARRLRNNMMRDELFGEPAWDMLLALYCLPDRGLIITVSTLTYCTDVPETTGLRWQNVLIREGLIERRPDGTDQRRHLVSLSSTGRTLMDAYLTRLFYKSSPLPAPDREPVGG